MLMIKMLKAQFETGKESIQAITHGSQFGYPSCAIEDIPVIRNTAMVRATGAIGGLASNNAITGTPIIVVEKGLDKDIEMFILHHELAHIRNGDLEKVNTSFKFKMTMLKRMFGYVPEEEIIADARAIEELGVKPALKALGWLYEKTYSSELKKRMEIIIRENMEGVEKHD